MKNQKIFYYTIKSLAMAHILIGAFGVLEDMSNVGATPNNISVMMEK